MSSGRDPDTGLLAAAAVVATLCCAVPMLAAVGVFAALAGIALRTWLLIGAGLALASFALQRRYRRRARRCP